MKTCVLGAGSWGIALAVLLAHNGHTVNVWSIDEKEIQMLNEHREHITKLPGVKIDEKVSFSTDVKVSVSGTELIVTAVPSPFIRSTAKTIAPYIDNQIIVNVSKGIESDTLMVLTDVILSEIPGVRIGVLSGPSHAEEVGKLLPTTIVAGASDRETAMLIQDTFMCETFRVYTSPDVVGIELGGALKNVIALAAGVADGLGCGDNAKAAIITRGISEITRLGVAMGGHTETFSGLSGIGDLIVTCASEHSRNRRAGVLMGQGMTYKQAMDEVKMVVEGVYSAKAALMLGKKYNIEMPLVETVNRVLFENLSAKDAMKQLLTRTRTDESHMLEWD